MTGGLTNLVALLDAHAASSDSPTIIVGGGVNPWTIGAILDVLLSRGLQEIHMSGGSWRQSAVIHSPEGIPMGLDGHEWDVWGTLEDSVRKVRTVADQKYS